jgi:hypothetical protein
MQKVDSSIIREIGYDPDSSTMQIRFVSGSLYLYSNVTPEVHQEIVSASSVGTAFWELLRRHEETYPFVRLDG